MTTIELHNIFRSIAQENINLNSFSSGDIFEADQHIDTLFPTLFFETPSFNFNNNYKKYNIALQFLDITLPETPGQNLNATHLNAQKVLTRMELILHSYVARLKQLYPKWFVNPTEFNAIPVTDDYNNRVYGWRIEFVINIAQNSLDCYPPNQIGINCTII